MYSDEVQGVVVAAAIFHSAHCVAPLLHDSATELPATSEPSTPEYIAERGLGEQASMLLRVPTSLVIYAVNFHMLRLGREKYLCTTAGCCARPHPIKKKK